MANFQTHITVGVLSSGVISTVAMAAAIISPSDAVALTIAGTVGSILPDMDLEGSRQSKTIFGGFAVFFAFLALFRYSQFLSVAELCVLWLAIYVLIRYLLWKLFHEFTVHRGQFHSLLANLLFAGLGTIVFYRLLGKTDTVSWLGGLIIFIGAMTHLLLDEIYSIDFWGNRVKRSFGTALKFYEYKKPASAIAMTFVVIGTLYFSPPIGNFYALMRSSENWAYLQTRLLPKENWFDLDLLRERLAEAEFGEVPATTGSIKGTE